MKKEKALEYIPKFPELSEKINKQINNEFLVWLIADKKRRVMRCTRCGEISPDDPKAKQGDIIVCPACENPARYKKNHYEYVAADAEKYIAVLLSAPRDETLYIRCFIATRYVQKGKLEPLTELAETQRYVFTEDFAARFGRDHDWVPAKGGWLKKQREEWTVRTRLTEPVFDGKANCYYALINKACIKQTCMRYSEFNNINFGIYSYYYGAFSPINYLIFYRKHKGCERLIKCGLEDIVADQFRCYEVPDKINWNETEPHKMLGITKDALRAIRDKQISLSDYRTAREYFPGVPLNKLIGYVSVLHDQYGTLENMARITGERETDILNYLVKQSAAIDLYRDYIECCRDIHADFSDRVIVYPRDFNAAHDRAAAAKKAVIYADLKKEFDQRLEERRELEFSFGNLTAVQPKNAKEIVAEGRVLCHCVGGYAERHAKGALTIMFLRKKSAPEKPYYTIEVSRDNKIIQCRGYRNNRANNPKPKAVSEFEKRYQQYLNALIGQKARKTA